MQITFSLPHVFYPGSNRDEDADALRDSLDYLIRLNLSFLRHTAVAPLYQSGVRYGRTTIWDTIPALYKRGYGDCKSLTAALVAQYRIARIDCAPVFRWVRRNDGSGSTDYHILVQVAPSKQNPDGFEDPSKVLGMGKNENAPIKR